MPFKAIRCRKSFYVNFHIFFLCHTDTDNILYNEYEFGKLSVLYRKLYPSVLVDETDCVWVYYLLSIYAIRKCIAWLKGL